MKHGASMILTKDVQDARRWVTVKTGSNGQKRAAHKADRRKAREALRQGDWVSPCHHGGRRRYLTGRDIC